MFASSASESSVPYSISVETEISSCTEIVSEEFTIPTSIELSRLGSVA